MIYTNNQGPPEWANYIMKYFEEKIDYKIFDQIIAAFKIQGKKVELCRTTHMKTHADFIKCTKLPEKTQICFLDDVFYPGMSNEKIYYINVKPYIHDLDFNEMITRIFNHGSIITDIDDSVQCRQFLISFMRKFNYIYVDKTENAQQIDNIISKKILQHLHAFFKMKPIESPSETSQENIVIILKTKRAKRCTHTHSLKPLCRFKNIFWKTLLTLNEAIRELSFLQKYIITFK